MLPKAFIKPIEPHEQLPKLLQALNLLHKFSFWHNMAVNHHGSQNNLQAKVWYQKTQDFLQQNLIQQNMENETIEEKYSVYNSTYNSYLIPNPNGLQGSYVFGFEKEKTVWFDNQLYTEVMVQRYNEMYPECIFKLIKNNFS